MGFLRNMLSPSSRRNRLSAPASPSNSLSLPRAPLVSDEDTDEANVRPQTHSSSQSSSPTSSPSTRGLLDRRASETSRRQRWSAPPSNRSERTLRTRSNIRADTSNAERSSHSPDNSRSTLRYYFSRTSSTRAHNSRRSRRANRTQSRRNRRQRRRRSGSFADSSPMVPPATTRTSSTAAPPSSPTSASTSTSAAALSRRSDKKADKLATEMTSLLKGLLHLRLSNVPARTSPVTCIICTEELESGQIVTRLPCGHLYHAMCVLQWFLHSSHRKNKGLMQQLQHQQAQARAQVQRQLDDEQQRHLQHGLEQSQAQSQAREHTHTDSRSTQTGQSSHGPSPTTSRMSFQRKSKCSYCWTCPTCRHVMTSESVNSKDVPDYNNEIIRSRFQQNEAAGGHSQRSGTDISADDNSSSSASGVSQHSPEYVSGSSDDSSRTSSDAHSTIASHRRPSQKEILSDDTRDDTESTTEPPNAKSVFAWCGSDPICLHLMAGQATHESAEPAVTSTGETTL